MKILLKIAALAAVAALAAGRRNPLPFLPEEEAAGRSSAPEWRTSFQLGGKAVKPEEGKFTLTFLAEENRIAGVGACNRIMGKYEATEKGVLKIGPLASTMMACPGMEQEDAFTKALESTTHYDMDGPMLAPC